MDEVSDERIRGMQTNLTGMLQLSGDGFANHMIWKSELDMLLSEVMRCRDKPLHCRGDRWMDHFTDAVDNLDSAVFSGDGLFNAENRVLFRGMLERWQRKLVEWEEIAADTETDGK